MKKPYGLDNYNWKIVWSEMSSRYIELNKKSMTVKKEDNDNDLAENLSNV